MAKSSLVIVASGIGLLECSTTGGYEAIHEGIADSGSLIVVGPWAREAARRYRGEDLGVQLVLTSPNPHLPLRPLTNAPTLIGGEGAFPATGYDLAEHADAEEVYTECRAQIERAIVWGIPVSFLSVFEQVAWLRPDLFDAVISLAEEFCIAVAITPDQSQEKLGYEAYLEANRRGILTLAQSLEVTDELATDPLALVDALAQWAPKAKPGLTQVAIMFATDTPELRSWAARPAAHFIPLEMRNHLRELERVFSHDSIERTTYRSYLSRHTNPWKGPSSYFFDI
jgi:predicted glycoside hydrolase/deacetylase ChbG (UPF0249 family)